MLTEEQAKEKWCPYANETRITRQTETCFASECMAWRWIDTEEHMRGTTNEAGYCGLAGKPDQ